jgi:hypothetical protein
MLPEPTEAKIQAAARLGACGINANPVEGTAVWRNWSPTCQATPEAQDDAKLVVAAGAKRYHQFTYRAPA